MDNQLSSVPKKNISVKILSKGRKYYKCKLNEKYDCKLISTEELELDKTYDFLVDDISIRTKYGTDLIFSSVSQNKKEEFVTLKHNRYNVLLTEKCKKLGGKWDDENKCWVFNKIVENEVEELDYIYSSELVNVEIKSKDRLSNWHEAIEFCGYSLCRAFGRDSGAKLSADIALIKGTVTSGGSRANWTTVICENTVLRLNVPLKLLEKYRNSEEKIWEIKII